MGEFTKIAWTDASWNPWRGCKKVSAGCANCYMFADQKRYGRNPEVVVRSKTTFQDPVKWQIPKKIFVCSWSDFFLEEADPWRDEAWKVIRRTPWHTFQLCTKRPENIKGRLPEDWGAGYPNVWLGVTTENQEQFDLRVPQLLEHEAVVRWVSIEPQLELVDVAMGVEQLDWLVVGGESGPKGRPFNLDWARSVLRQGQEAGKAVFVKQMGRRPIGLSLGDSHGADVEKWPEDLKVRQFPGETE